VDCGTDATGEKKIVESFAKNAYVAARDLHLLRSARATGVRTRTGDRRRLHPPFAHTPLLHSTEHSPTAVRAGAAGAPAPTVLFLHIPKTGGRTLLHLARRQYPPDAIEEIYGDLAASLARFRALPRRRKHGLAFIAGHYPFGLHRQVPGNCTYLTLLRHPVRRVVSDYQYMLRRPTHWAHERIHRDLLTLDQVLDEGFSVLMDNGQTRVLSSARDEVPFGACGPEHLEEAKENLRGRFAAVGITERFDESFSVIKRVLSWRGWRVRNANVSKLRPQPLAPGTRRRIESLNRFDLELYAFADRLLDSQLASVPGARSTARAVRAVSGLLAAGRAARTRLSGGT